MVDSGRGRIIILFVSFRPMPRLGHICWLTALALSAAAVEPPPAFPGVLVTPHPGVAAPLPAGVGVGVGLPDLDEESLQQAVTSTPPEAQGPVDPPNPTGPHDMDSESLEVSDIKIPVDDEAGKLLDEIENSDSASQLAAAQHAEHVKLGTLAEEAHKAAEAQHLLELRVHHEHQRRLREEARRMKVQDRFNERLLRAQKTCTKWQREKDKANSELQGLYEKSVKSSSQARDGARRGLAPILVEKELHVTDMSINALRCQMNYMESLRVFVEGACGVSKRIRLALAAYITSPTENVTIPSADIPRSVPTPSQINLLKLTASNAIAKVDVARHDYDVEKTRVDARPPLDDASADSDMDAAAEGEEDAHEMETPPHELPIDVLFEHIMGRSLVAEVPKVDSKKLEAKKKRILQEQEDCFGDDCGDPKTYVPLSMAPAPAL